MRKPLVIMLAAFLAAAALVQAQDQPAYLSPDDLDNLLAPVALYPDPLVAQILPAATFPDQIDEAAQFLQANGDPNAIDIQPWDVSVQALAHYSGVIDMMASHLDWTTELGQAYVNQPDDVMNTIQRLRREARAAGNLVSTPQQEVVMDGNYVDIWPAEPDEIYVPMYDPSLAYFGSGAIYGGSVLTFSPGFVIGAWLNFDCDWRDHRVFYHQWRSDKGWVARALPYIHITPNYVNNRFQTVPVNRGVVSHPVNRNNMARFEEPPVARPVVRVPAVPEIRPGAGNFRAPMVSPVATARPAQQFRPALVPAPRVSVPIPHLNPAPAPRPIERTR